MLFEDSYNTISTKSEGLYKEKGSKFIAYAFPVTAEDEIKEHLAALRKEHFNAKHHCYAYRLKPDKSVFRTNDDGEPSNTAGKPILGQIHSFDLTNVLIVVVRYFGGTLLGVGGLINAYKMAAKDALDHAEILAKRIEEVYEISFSYEMLNEVMKLLKSKNVRILNQNLNLPCSIKFSVFKSEADKLLSELKKHGEVNYIATV